MVEKKTTKAKPTLDIWSNKNPPMSSAALNFALGSFIPEQWILIAVGFSLRSRHLKYIKKNVFNVFRVSHVLGEIPT